MASKCYSVLNILYKLMLCYASDAFNHCIVLEIQSPLLWPESCHARGFYNLKQIYYYILIMAAPF